MEIIDTNIAAVKRIQPVRHGDERGFFSEVFRKDIMAAAGLPSDWIQDNHSRSAAVGTIRGLHFQGPPFAQAKLVRVTRGRILDVAVDLRRTSPTFGQHVLAELSEANWTQLYIPVGFAHGFCTLEPDTEVQYKVTAPYAPQHDFGLTWDDPDLGIPWPEVAQATTLSRKDAGLPRLADLPAYFE